MKILYIILIAVVITGCITEKKRAEICSKCPNKTEIKTVVKDSIYYIERDSLVILPPDSSLIEMLLKCDSIGRVSIESMRQKDGTRIKTKIVFKDNILKLTSLNDSIQVLNKIISKYKETSADSSFISQATITINKCESWWHTLFMWWFCLTFTIIIIYIFIKLR
jgi:hypothetical protein